MIGTHDSYTFLQARNKIYELFSFLWRTQDKNIYQQKEAGVSYFDIRVRRDINKWRVCHGLVDFNLTFKGLEEILNCFSTYKVRIILERGNTQDETLFTKEALEGKYYPALTFSCIKKGWKVIVDRDPYMADFTYVPWLSGLTFWQNIKRFNFFSTIKRWAKKHRPAIDDNIKKDTSIVYFMDYV